MGRISRSNALVGNVYVWENRKSVTGGSYDISLTNSTGGTVAKVIGVKGQTADDSFVDVYYYKGGTIGGTTETPFNTNLSDNAASNAITCKAGLGSLTGGTLLPMVDKVHYYYDTDGTLGRHQNLSIEIPAGESFTMRLIPATGGTLYAGLTWVEH